MAAPSVPTTRLRHAALVLVALAAAGLAGCDKCGHPVQFNTPSIQKACGDDAAR